MKAFNANSYYELFVKMLNLEGNTMNNGINVVNYLYLLRYTFHILDNL